MLEGLMQNDFQLSLQHVRRRMGQIHAGAQVVTLTEEGPVRASFGEISQRVDRLAVALRRLGIEPGDRVGTFAWNNQRHFELYLAVPCIGAVLHTLNIRLFAEQLSPDPMITKCSTSGMRSTCGSSRPTRLASTNTTRSRAWLTMYTSCSANSRMLSVCNTAPMHGTAR